MHNFAAIPFFFIVISAALCSPEVTIGQGTLRGAVKLTEKQNEFNSFTGIPYAKPPVGKLRFKPPVPSAPWSGVFDATKGHARCLQAYTYLKNHTVTGSEDCLYLNIYTPQLKPTSNLAVMLFIHGGAFITGSAMDYDPSLFMNEDIFLVTINYRLGPLGFFSSGSIDALGNYGLKDQALAIKWVKANIAAFGGDPERITLFGQGAGGISAHFHAMSPMSKGLISGVIAQSGTALALNALMPYFLSVRMSNFLAQRLECPTEEDVDDMLKCMMSKDSEEIIKAATTLTEWDIEPVTVFKPVMEPDHESAFLSADPIDIIVSGKSASVPFMTGITKDEGDFRTAQLFNDPKLLEEFNQHFNDRISLVLNYKEIATPKHQKAATNKIADFYFNKKKLNEKSRKAFSEAYMDANYLSSANYASDLYSNKGKNAVYFYVFGYKGPESYCSLIEGLSPDSYGVCHSDDLLYLFGNKELFPDSLRNQQGSKVAELMAKLWTNFAKFGNPTPDSQPDLVKWESYSAQDRKCYVINESPSVEDCYKQRTEFWRNLDLNERTTTLRKHRSGKSKDEL
ncbi:hypothetical protein PPYR_08790 [Photinus pyralis]|nr:hypothetical protein PPYR_08790 [Photinus pyralis]